MSKGQSSLEFLAMISLSALMLAALQAALVSKQSQALEFQNREKAERIAEYGSFQVELAMVQDDGYSRVFSVPENVGGQRYTLEMFNGSARLRWGNQSVILSSRYQGERLNLTGGESNVYRVVNDGGDIHLREE